MKKLTKIFAVLTLLFSMFASLGLGANEVMATSTDDTVTVTLHKKKMTSFPNPLIQNTGGVMAEFAGYDDMPNVTFEVHDVTAQFYGLRSGGSTATAAMAAVAANPDPYSVGIGTTLANGKVSFNLPAKSGGKDAVYVFVETDAPAGTTPSANLALVLPLYDAEDKLMTDIHLYPKNIVAADGTVTITKKGTASGEVLKDAKFIVSRELTVGDIEYLLEFNTTKGLWDWTATKDNANVFTTDSLGQITITGLEHGDYKLIETAAPDNASIIGEGITEFTISGTTSLALDVLNDTILVEKEHTGETTDYNVGDLIPYTGSVNIPVGIGDKLANDAYKHPALIITDVPVAGLMYNGDLTATIDGAAFDITGMVTPTTNGFILNIPAASLVDFAGKDLDIAYNMYLDGTAVPDLGYKNTIEVDTGLLEDEDETEEVFTGGHRFIKVDANFDTQNALAGAVFVVRDSDADDASYLKIGANNAVTWVADRANATEYTSSDSSDFRGQILVHGLEEGEYWLEEVQAPADYVLRDERTKFNIVIGTYGDTQLEIINVRKGQLPSTGGSGIIGIVSLGAVLVATTGGYYIKRRKEA